MCIRNINKNSPIGKSLFVHNEITRIFYTALRREVIFGNPYLNFNEQYLLQQHHEVIMNAWKYPPNLATAIYVNRRAPAVQAVLTSQDAVVFDAGCGFGSESFLFARLGAKVLAVDLSPEQISIGEKRKSYFENKVFKKRLDITFHVADLTDYLPETSEVSLTWVASVLAALPDQEDFLRRVYAVTRPGGQVMVTDMNLGNPLFLFREWQRRQRAQTKNLKFARQADFWSMVWRRGRSGARFFPNGTNGEFDDVQFFTAKSLGALLKLVGFRIVQPRFSGFVPPPIFVNSLTSLEDIIAKVPGLRNLGYFYVVTGIKERRNVINN
jgi:SAM-dependent methyltransferase